MDGLIIMDNFNCNTNIVIAIENINYKQTNKKKKQSDVQHNMSTTFILSHWMILNGGKLS